MANSTEGSTIEGVFEIPKSKIWQVIGASSAGTVIEWYDFYIFGSLAAVISPLFYPKGNDTLALIAYLSTFAVGFIVRPFGALFFGRIGDLVGRKFAFLITLLLMGGATAAVGFLPTYETIGIVAPIALIIIRVLQGLALGGEYGGAAVYVAEHVPGQQTRFLHEFYSDHGVARFADLARRHFDNSKHRCPPKHFPIWGWRIPFLLSIFLVGMSLYIRLRMKESPIFQHIKSTGMASAKPLVDAFMNPENRKRVLISLFGATAGQGVVWYTGQFYALFYMQTILKIEQPNRRVYHRHRDHFGDSAVCIFWRIVRQDRSQKDNDGGLFARGFCYYPIYQGMVHYAGNEVAAIQSATDPITKEPKLYAGNGQMELPIPVQPRQIQMSRCCVFLVFLQIVFVTMVYAPIAAYLVEAFPAKVRYTSLSLPYHIGNGVFGGLAANDRLDRLRLHRKYLRRTLVSDDNCRR